MRSLSAKVSGETGHLGSALPIGDTADVRVATKLLSFSSLQIVTD